MRNPTQRRLNELEWTLARVLHPGAARRHFGIAWSADGQTFTNAYPVEISVERVTLISPEEPKTRRFIVTLQLDGKRVQAAAQCVSVEKGMLRGNVMWRIVARFLELANDVRNLIERFVRGLPLTAPPAPTPGVLPDTVVRGILQELVRLGRLSPQRNRMQPLVKINYMGVIRRGTQPLHSLKIESRVVHNDSSTVYRSQAYVSERLTKIEVIPLDNGLPEMIVPTSRRANPARRMRNWMRRLTSN